MIDNYFIGESFLKSPQIIRKFEVLILRGLERRINVYIDEFYYFYTISLLLSTSDVPFINSEELTSSIGEMVVNF